MPNLKETYRPEPPNPKRKIEHSGTVLTPKETAEQMADRDKNPEGWREQQ